MTKIKHMPIDTKAILAADARIWEETVGPLARCLVAYVDALGLDYYDHVQLGPALHGLGNELGRIAAILYPEESARQREYLDWLVACREQRPVKISIPRALRKAVFERDDFRCKRCGERWDLCVDHKIPESRGGETTLENLQTLCKWCNSLKGNRMESPAGD